MNSRPIQLMAFVALFAMSAIGFIQLTDYSSRPGRSGEAPSSLADLELSDASLVGNFRANGKASLLIFYHPKCPCTAATVRVLERLHPRFMPTPQITAIAFCPENEADSWVKSGTTTALSSLAGSRIMIDRAGKISTRFGVFVSGHILLYDKSGQLTFSGGITPYRGHEGDSPSSLDLLDRIRSPRADCGQWPVFGCSTAAQPKTESGQ